MQGSNRLVLQLRLVSLSRLSKQNAKQLVADSARPLVAVLYRPSVVHLARVLRPVAAVWCQAARPVVAHLGLLRPSVSPLVELLEVPDLKWLR